MKNMFISHKGKKFSYYLNDGFDQKRLSRSPIIFLHGWGGDANSFAGLAHELSDFPILTVDFWGSGKSDRVDAGWTLCDYVQPIVEIIKLQGLESCALVGHSFGGRVSVRLATDSSIKNRIEKLVLIDAAGIKPRFSFLRWARVRHYKMLKFLANCAIIKKEKLNGYGSDDYKKLNSDERRVFSKIVNENLAKTMKSIEIPTLLIWGEKDRDTPLYMAKKINTCIQGSGLIILDGASHYSYVEKQREVALIIENFFEKGD